MKEFLTPKDFAKYIQFPNGYPNVILTLGVGRGGTTAMSKVLSCSPSFDAFGEDILRNAIAYPTDQDEEPVTIQMPGNGQSVFLKETYGPITPSMIVHYPIRVLQLAAKRTGISEAEFIKKTHVLGITRDPLAIYNGWLKYWMITKDPKTIDEAFKKYGQLALTNLIAANNCFLETIISAQSQGIDTSMVVMKVFEHPDGGVENVIQKICDRLEIEFTPSMVMFQDIKKKQKMDLYPVSVDEKYKGIHKEIDNKGFRYILPNHKDTYNILPSLEEAGLIQSYKRLNQMSEGIFGKIALPNYMD